MTGERDNIPSDKAQKIEVALMGLCYIRWQNRNNPTIAEGILQHAAGIPYDGFADMNWPDDLRILEFHRRYPNAFPNFKRQVLSVIMGRTST
jgi:hypothetical protein